MPSICRDHGTRSVHEEDEHEGEWTPRSGNREADELAHGGSDSFHSRLQMPVRASALHWVILEQALQRAEMHTKTGSIPRKTDTLREEQFDNRSVGHKTG